MDERVLKDIVEFNKQYLITWCSLAFIGVERLILCLITSSVVWLVGWLAYRLVDSYLCLFISHIDLFLKWVFLKWRLKGFTLVWMRCHV